MNELKKDQFIELIQQEISILREVLSSLLQEEIFLLQQNQNSWNHLMKDRFSMIQKISSLRKKRAIYSVEAMQEPSCEVLLLIDQLTTLLDKTNKQSTRNQNLALNLQHTIAIPKTFPYAHNLKPSTEYKTPLQTTLMDNPLL